MSCLALALAACGSHVSTERCMQYVIREEECEGLTVDDAQRATLHGAYCATDVDRDHYEGKVDCVSQTTCEGFRRCAGIDLDHGTPFGVPR